MNEEKLRIFFSSIFQAWEKAIELCKELQVQHEESFEFENLASILVKKENSENQRFSFRNFFSFEDRSIETLQEYNGRQQTTFRTRILSNRLLWFGFSRFPSSNEKENRVLSR